MIEFVNDFLEAIVRLRWRGRIEGIGLDDVGARFEVSAMNPLDQVGPSQRQQIVVALQIRRPVGKSLTPIVRLAETVLLDHRAHRAVQNGDAAAEQLLEFLRRFVHYGIPYPVDADPAGLTPSA